jgi:hypothetical protein
MSSRATAAWLLEPPFLQRIEEYSGWHQEGDWQLGNVFKEFEK